MTGALTITPAALHAALTAVEAIGRIQGTAAYAGGIAALRAMFGPDAVTSPIAAVPSEVRRALASTPPEARDKATTIEAGSAPSLAQELAQARHAVSPPSADPPIAIPPLPTGPGGAPFGARETPAACSAIPPPSPPPVLAAEGTMPAPRTKHAGQGARSAPCWPEARARRFDERYPVLGASQALLDELNAIDAKMPLESLGALKARASRQGLRMDPEVKRSMYVAHAARAREARAALPPETPASDAETAPEEAVAAATPEPAPPSVVPAPPTMAPVQPGDEKADAFAYFDAGKFVRDVVEDFGVGVTTAVGWHAEWKRQQGVMS